MGRIFEVRKSAMFARWDKMAKNFTRIGKEIAIAVKAGGPDQNANAALRRCYQNARSVGMPKDRVEAAIKRAMGKEMVNYDEILYEGYAPHGIAILVETATDNPTRTVANVRMHFTKSGGSLGTSGSVAFTFTRMGEFKIKNSGLNIEDLELELIDYGLEEIGEDSEGNIIIRTAYNEFGHMASGEQQTVNNKKQTTVLQVENLKVHYPGKRKIFGKAPEPFKAVDDVSFTVSKGETVGLVGESGCGKTTLGRTILQLIPATAGRIILNGVDLAGLPKKQLQPLRKDLQIVFQDPYGSLNPRLTIGNAILEPMKVHSILNSTAQRKDKVMELLEKVNLQADHFNRYPHQFSGGQRQRICIARALALNPSFLIFDESVSALDVSVQAQVLNLLNDLKKEFEFTSIFISHDLSVVRYISDRILVMHKGKIVEEGLSDKVYFNPKQPYTKQLIDAVPGKKLVMRPLCLLKI